MKQSKKPKVKTNVKQKIAIAVFMECVPKIIAMWKNAETDLTFDSWLMKVYEENKTK